MPLSEVLSGVIADAKRISQFDGAPGRTIK